jgi:hypothetical protein
MNDAQLARLRALRDAIEETATLMREHGVRTAGELQKLGIAIPAKEVSDRLIRAYLDGEITAAELRELEIAYSPLGPPAFG